MLSDLKLNGVTLYQRPCYFTVIPQSNTTVHTSSFISTKILVKESSCKKNNKWTHFLIDCA